MNKLRTAVREEAEKVKAQRKAGQKKTFAKYDAIKIFEFPERDAIHMERHFYFPKILGPGPCGSTLSKAALAVYPVMCSRANFENNDWFQLPQEAIAKMAGVSIPTVGRGIKHLIDNKYRLEISGGELPLLERRMTTEGTRHFFLYRAGFFRKDLLAHSQGGCFIFHTCIIDSGVWAQLKPRAKALYLAMRSVALQDYETYRAIEDGNGFEWMTTYDEYLKMRKWDLVNTPLAELGRLININMDDANVFLKELERCRLVERVDRWHKVYLKPKI